MAGTTVHIAQTGGWALYLAQNLQYNTHANIGISPRAAQVRSVEYSGLNMRSCKYIVYVRHHCSHNES
jgi:hypothetical protein